MEDISAFMDSREEVKQNGSNRESRDENNGYVRNLTRGDSNPRLVF